MKATLLDVQRLTDTCHHHAFTDLCVWRGHYYCAYREARSHNIQPRGHIAVQERPGDAPETPWRWLTDLRHPHGDLRDPKFFVTADVLYLMCGVYLPHPAHRPLLDGLTQAPGDAILQTHLAYTTDGQTWSDLLPVLRPNYWGWSGVPSGKDDSWVIAAYHTGASGESMSVVLWGGPEMLALGPMSTIYEGASLEKESGDYRYVSSTPCEPVLWQVADTPWLGCLIRGASTMQLGVGKFPFGTADWRWTDTGQRVHPSAVLELPQGLLLAGREIEEGRRSRTHTTYETYTSLYALEGQRVRKLLRLPSGRDTGYAGLCAGPDGTVRCSYYSQHEVPQEVPGAAVYVATVEVSA